MTVVLTTKQIEDRYLRKEDGAPQYTITTGTIPEFEADSGEIIPAYTGLIAYQSRWSMVYCSWMTERPLQSSPAGGLDNCFINQM